MIVLLAALGLLTATAAPLDEPVGSGTVHVLVLDPQGRPIAGARVACQRLDPERDPPVPGRAKLGSGWQDAARSDADGRAVLTDLPAGLLRVAAGAPPEWTYHDIAPVEAGSSVTITLQAWPAERTLSGVVLTPDGKPRRGAYVGFVWDDHGLKQMVTTSTDTEGRFWLLAGETGVRGALHAYVWQHRFRSAAIDPVEVGATDVNLQLGPSRLLEVEVRDMQGEPVEHAKATFSWQLAGHPHQDYPGPQRRDDGVLWWELPSVPFYVDVVAPDHEEAHLGPLDPDEVGERLVVQLVAQPRVRGVVTHEGQPVPDVEVSYAPPDSRYRARAKTDADGRFDVAIRKPDTYTFRAWSPVLGEGETAALDLSAEQLEHGVPELEIPITRAPGSIEGRVIVPSDHDPRELWLTTRRAPGYMRLEPDGRFRMPQLPPGPHTVRVLQGYDRGDVDLPVSTSGTSRPAGEWFSITHGPARAPAWWQGPQTVQVDVPAGGTVKLDLDFTAPPACRFVGRLTLDGAPPPHRPITRGMYWDHGPRVVLHRGDEYDWVARVPLGSDGSFVLDAAVPGTYWLEIDVPAGERNGFTIRDQVELSAGVQEWTHDLALGTLEVLDSEGVSVRAGEWQSGGLSGRIGRRSRDYAIGATRFRVPAGTLRLSVRVAGEEREVDVEVVEGETTRLEFP